MVPRLSSIVVRTLQFAFRLQAWEEPQDFYVGSNTEHNFIGSTDAEKKVGHSTASVRERSSRCLENSCCFSKITASFF